MEIRRSQTFECTPASVVGIRAMITEVLDAAGVPEDDAFEVLVAVEEAAANACRHGCSPGSTIVVRCDFSPGRIMLTVADRGPGFDVSAIDVTIPPDPLAIGGRGLFLIHELMDAVSIDSSFTGTTVTMTAALPVRTQQVASL